LKGRNPLGRLEIDGIDEKCVRLLVRKPKRNTSIGRRGWRWEGNTA
jgi:hypothetical protein